MLDVLAPVTFTKTEHLPLVGEGLLCFLEIGSKRLWHEPGNASNYGIGLATNARYRRGVHFTRIALVAICCRHFTRGTVAKSAVAGAFDLAKSIVERYAPFHCSVHGQIA